ncbi:MAG: hypothetical protein ACK5CA_02040 [Cyanobacteriota bacterium]|jgi:uncharacterized protein YwgA
MEYETLNLHKSSLEKDLEHLTKQYEAIDDQYRFELNPATKINLEKQRQNILTEIDRVNSELKKINKDLNDLKIFNSEKLKIEEPQVNLQDTDSARLILDIRPKQELSGNLQEYIFSAWVYSQGSINKPFTINQEIAEAQLPDFLGTVIENCHKKGKLSIIEIFVSPEISTVAYENWQYLFLGDSDQLRRQYLVYIRDRERFENSQRYHFLESWQTNWTTVNNPNCTLQAQPNDSDWQKILSANCYWFNGCRLALQDYRIKLLKQGIPLVLWSRCAVAQETHWQEINSLLAQKTLNHALEQVIEKRKQAPTTIAEDSTELGHHLVLMLENPHHPPPWVGAEPLRS